MVSRYLLAPLLAVSFSVFAEENKPELAEVSEANSVCAAEKSLASRRRPGSRVEEELPSSCLDETNQPGILPWVDPIDLGPAVPD